MMRFHILLTGRELHFLKDEAMETHIRMDLPRKTSAPHFSRRLAHTCFALLAISLSSLAGCSSSSSGSTLTVDAIAFTDSDAIAQKPLTSLTVTQGTYLEAQITGDSKQLGVDWTVVCGSALPPGTPLPPGQTQDQSCGTFNPGHTQSGPVPTFAANASGYLTFYTSPPVPPKQGIVTLYASATSDHSRLSSVTISIDGLPISVGFAPAPPSSAGLNTAIPIKAVLNNDATAAGVTWSVICGSTDCGSFDPAQTASGVVTTYTSPGMVPTGGFVEVTATSLADPTKSKTATIQIVPVSIAVAPAILSVATAGSGSLTATVTNDGLGRGVDWSVACTNTRIAGMCGTITAHTASGAAATYTAPGAAAIPVGTTINVTVTSTTAPMQSATSTITITQGDLVNGVVRAGHHAVRAANITLYSVQNRENASQAIAEDGPNVVVSAMTNVNGEFKIPSGFLCPSADTQMYLLASGGDAGSGINSDLVLMTALGSCSKIDELHPVIDEATTVAAVYALSSFMTDARHVGTPASSVEGVAAAFAAASDLVDVRTGTARSRTVSGAGVIPQAKIDTLANLISGCAQTAGSMKGDGSPCDELFRLTSPGAERASTQPDTVQALLHLARNATGFTGAPDSVAALYRLASSSPYSSPVLDTKPGDWTLSIEYSSGLQSAPAPRLATALMDVALASVTSAITDAAGNVWLRAAGGTLREFVGGASSAGAPATLIPLAAEARRNP